MTCTFKTVAIQNHQKPIKLSTKMASNPNDNSSRSADQGSDDSTLTSFQVELSAKTGHEKRFRHTRLVCESEYGSYGSFQIEKWREPQPTGPQEGSEFTVDIPSDGFSNPFSIASGEDVDRVPEVKDLKLGRCKQCAKSHVDCITKGRRGTICERCLKKNYTCEYTYLEPRGVSRCDKCTIGSRRCSQSNATQSKAPQCDCSRNGICPCVHRPCDRCLGIRVTCSWENVKKSRALRSVWARDNGVFEATEEGEKEGGGVEEDSLHSTRLDNLTVSLPSSELLS